MKKVVQAKHLSERHIIEVVKDLTAKSQSWAFAWDVIRAHPGFPEKVVRAKLRAMVARGAAEAIAEEIERQAEVHEKSGHPDAARIGRECAAVYRTVDERLREISMEAWSLILNGQKHQFEQRQKKRRRSRRKR